MGYVAAAALLAAAVLLALSDGRERLARAGGAVAGLAAAALAALLVHRSLRIGFPALTGTYEGLIMSIAVLAAVIAGGRRRIFGGETRLMALAAAFGFVAMVILSSPVVSTQVHPPLPILRSGWLVLHVAFAFVGLSLFTVSAIATVAALVHSARGETERAAAADRLRDRSIVGGFVFYATGGLVFGAIWAEAAWGRFWGWDPKETWALITTLSYAVYLHLRYVRKASPTALRVIALAAWALGLFTFFGVNYLLAGLHSYA
jgi:ABC-type transport system involved in cytochrome c biogenesis permease subunit